MMGVLPRQAQAALVAHAAPLVALALALAGVLAGRRGGGEHESDAVGAGAVLAGWVTLAGWWRLPEAIARWHGGVSVLLAPAAGVLLLRLLAMWRFGQRPRLLLWAEAGFVGWWLAHAAGPVEFWRVWLAIGLLVWLMRRGVGRESFRGLSMAATLLAGLMAAGGAAVWHEAALVAAAATSGFVLGGAAGGVPAACLVVLVAAVDLAGGRLVGLHLNGVDLACAAALAAPALAGALAKRMGGGQDRLLALAAALLPAAGLGLVVLVLVRGFGH